MSNELMFSEALARPLPDAEEAPARAGRSADAELVLAAIDRMEAAIQEDRAAFERLRAELGAMANAIALAKAAVQSSAIKPDESPGGKPIHALLDELEHRIDAAIEIAGGSVPVARAVASPAAEAARPPPEVAAGNEAVQARAEAPPVFERPSHEAAEIVSAGETPQAPAPEPEAAVPAPDRVPTVSGVVSRLNRSGETSATGPDEATPAGHGVTTVSMLEAMVQALTAAAMLQPQSPARDKEVAASAPEAALPVVQAVPPAAEEPLPATEAAPPELEAVPPAQEAAQAEPAVAAQDSEPQAAASEPGPSAIEAVPPARAVAQVEPAPSDEVTQAQPAVETPTASLQWPAIRRDPIIPENDLLTSFARMEAFPILPPDEVGTAVIFASRAEPQPDPVAPAEPPVEAPQSAAAAEPQAEPAPSAGQASQPAERDLDASDLLFDPPSETDPAAFLLEPAPPAEASGSGAATESTVDEATVTPPRMSAFARHDPLIPLKAMSEEERIALFS